MLETKTNEKIELMEKQTQIEKEIADIKAANETITSLVAQKESEAAAIEALRPQIAELERYYPHFSFPNSCFSYYLIPKPKLYCRITSEMKLSISGQRINLRRSTRKPMPS